MTWKKGQRKIYLKISNLGLTVNFKFNVFLNKFKLSVRNAERYASTKNWMREFLNFNC